MDTVTIRIPGLADDFLEGSSLAQQTPEQTGYPSILHHAYETRKVSRLGLGYTILMTLPATPAGADAIEMLQRSLELGLDGATQNRYYSEMKALRDAINRCKDAVQEVDMKGEG